MSKRTKPRLGKGLSGMIGTPVPIEPPSSTETPDQVSTNNAITKDDSGSVPRPSSPVRVEAGGESPSQQVSRSQSESVSLPDGRRMRAIEVSAIEPNRYQPRRAFDADALEALADSIKRSGVMQPIAVRTAQGDSEKAWELVAGERRWRAAQRAGLKKIPAVVVALSERESAEWALVENLQREDLDPMERADALKGLAEEFGLTHQQISEQVGLDRATVSNLIRMTELEPEIRLLITSREDERLTAGHGRALLAVEGSPARIELARTCAREGWSVRALEREIAARKNDDAQGEHPAKSPAPTHRSGTDPHIADLERQLGEALGTRVRIDANDERTKGKVIISFYDLTHFDSITERLGISLQSL